MRWVTVLLRQCATEEDTESIVMGLSGSPVESNLQALNILAKVPEDRFVADLDGAREVARNILNVTTEPIEPEPTEAT